ncbi:MAG: hypothetical protein ACPGJV_15885, partial [Bacteriovoracaceae bacterium]
KPGLKESIRNSLYIGKSRDIFARVYWVFPDRYKMEVIGLPKGFQELRNHIKAELRAYVAYVIPPTFEEKFSNFLSKPNKTEEGTLYTITIAKDHPDPNIKLLFDKQMNLIKSWRDSTKGQTDNEFVYETYGWSQNKLALKKMKTNYRSKISDTEVSYEVKYKTFSGFGFPVEVKTTTSFDGTKAIKKDAKVDKSKLKWSRSQKIIMKNFVPNENVAKNYFKIKKIP